jgi:RNA polymerase sigma-70 factor, ECF subfamily
MSPSDARFRELYRAFGRVVHARCRRILGDGTAAEDATQETFLRVFRHLDKAPDNQEAIAWIYRIATNYCLNELRNRRLRASPDGAPDPQIPHQRSLEQLLQDRELALLVMAGVPEKLRAPAYLCHVDGLPQPEASRILGISRRTLVYRLASFQARAHRLLAAKT